MAEPVAHALQRIERQRLVRGLLDTLIRRHCDEELPIALMLHYVAPCEEEFAASALARCEDLTPDRAVGETQPMRWLPRCSRSARRGHKLRRGGGRAGRRVSRCRYPLINSRVLSRRPLLLVG